MLIAEDKTYISKDATLFAHSHSSLHDVPTNPFGLVLDDSDTIELSV
jgi:hypothetical protein